MIRSETSVAHPLTLAGRAPTNRVSAGLIHSGRQVEAATPECYSRSKKRIAAAPASATPEGRATSLSSEAGFFGKRVESRSSKKREQAEGVVA
jgi:hypothetical protein